jgi:hypothetical protein
MGDQGQERTEITGWKNIADYLGNSERTCRRLVSEAGLPIRGREGLKKPRIFAYADELDIWKAEKLKPKANRAAAPVEPVVSPSKRLFLGRIRLASPYLWATAALSALVLLVAFTPSKGEPDHYAFQKSQVIVLDGRGREIDRFATNIERLDPSFYKNRNQTRQAAPEAPNRYLYNLPLEMTRDTDGDGSKEFLFVAAQKSQPRANMFYCRNKDPRKNWQFNVNNVVENGFQRYTSDFVTTGFLAEDLDNDGFAEIVLIANYPFDYPTEVIVLNHLGKCAGRYWNAGQINDLCFGDINQDGFKEIVLAGQNEEYKRPVLIVLDGKRISGASPQTGKYVFKGKERGRPIYYLRLPRTAADDQIANGIAAEMLDISNGTISLWTENSNIKYEFDFDLSVISVTPSDTYKNLYREYERSGLITRPFDGERERAKLIAGISYFDGMAWSPRRAMVTKDPL